MEVIMETKNRPQYIRTTVTLTETDAPVLSCCLNLESNETGYRGALNERVRLLRQSLTGTERRDLEEAVGRIEASIPTELLPGAEDYPPAPGWSWAACGMLATESVPPRAGPECGAQGIRPHDLKEEMARIAEQQGGHIETVRDSAVLVVGGVGCLLRYRPSERYGGDDDNQGAP